MPFGGLLTVGAVSGITSIVQGLLGSNAANNASEAQIAAAREAIAAQERAQDKNIALQLGVYEQTREDQMPWLEAGRGGLSRLQALLSAGGELDRGFQAPEHFRFDPSRLMEDPGYQFRLTEGQRALQRSAAAKGSALGGGTLRALAEYGQGLASQEYGNAYGRAAGEYDRNFTNDFNVFQTNQANKYNRLASLAGIGQTAANTIGNANAGYAQNAGNAIMQTGGNVADLTTQAGNARASGYIGGANAWGGALANIAQTGVDLYGLNRRYR